MNESYLLDNEGMRMRTDIPNWVAKEFQNFSSVVLEPTFPCYFGLTALKRMNFVIPFSLIMIGVICHIQCYLFRANERASNCKKRLFSFVEPECEEQSLEYYRDYFWKVLQYLHENDKETWPKQIAKDPDHYLWEFSFGGEPIFAFGNAPAYKQRKTRHLGNSLVIGFQPRTIFDGLEGDRPKGAYSRQTVRERVEKWDQLPKHPNISHYGDPNHREWKQYFIGDDIEPIKENVLFFIR